MHSGDLVLPLPEPPSIRISNGARPRSIWRRQRRLELGRRQALARSPLRSYHLRSSYVPPPHRLSVKCNLRHHSCLSGDALWRASETRGPVLL